MIERTWIIATVHVADASVYCSSNFRDSVLVTAACNCTRREGSQSQSRGEKESENYFEHLEIDHTKLQRIE